jgi:hypothetical protein
MSFKNSRPFLSPFFSTIGGLSLSRGIGDFRYKTEKDFSLESQAVTANPEITCQEITDEDEFLILASDGSFYSKNTSHPCPYSQMSGEAGIRKCLTFEEVVDIRYPWINPSQRSPGSYSTSVLAQTQMMGKSPGQDSTTMVLVAFLHSRTQEEWVCDARALSQGV